MKIVQRGTRLKLSIRSLLLCLFALLPACGGRDTKPDNATPVSSESEALSAPITEPMLCRLVGTTLTCLRVNPSTGNVDDVTPTTGSDPAFRWDSRLIPGDTKGFSKTHVFQNTPGTCMTARLNAAGTRYLVVSASCPTQQWGRQANQVQFAQNTLGNVARGCIQLAGDTESDGTPIYSWSGTSCTSATPLSIQPSGYPIEVLSKQVDSGGNPMVWQQPSSAGVAQLFGAAGPWNGVMQANGPTEQWQFFAQIGTHTRTTIAPAAACSGGACSDVSDGNGVHILEDPFTGALTQQWIVTANPGGGSMIGFLPSGGESCVTDSPGEGSPLTFTSVCSQATVLLANTL